MNATQRSHVAALVKILHVEQGRAWDADGACGFPEVGNVLLLLVRPFRVVDLVNSAWMDLVHELAENSSVMEPLTNRPVTFGRSSDPSIQIMTRNSGSSALRHQTLLYDWPNHHTVNLEQCTRSLN